MKNIFTLLFFVCNTAVGRWSASPTVNNVVCTTVSQQMTLKMISDGSWEIIVTWLDYNTNTGNYNIYAQRMADKTGRDQKRHAVSIDNTSFSSGIYSSLSLQVTVYNK